MNEPRFLFFAGMIMAYALGFDGSNDSASQTF